MRIAPSKKHLYDALRLTSEEVKRRKPKELASALGSSLRADGLLAVPFRGQEVLFDPGTGQFVGESLPSLKARILILHYLSRVSEKPIDGEAVNFRRMPEGRFYWGPFRSRAVLPLIKAFGNDLSGLEEAMRKSGGEKVEGGDFACRFAVLPKVEFTYVCRRGSEEFAPEIDILFDNVVSVFLSTEDVAACLTTLCFEIIHNGPKV